VIEDSGNWAMPDDIHSQPLLIEIAIEPKSRDEQAKLGIALAELVSEDPSLGVSTNQVSGQTILKGTSESHLDGQIDILKRTYRIDANIGPPQVAYHETITRAATVDFTHKKQTGGAGQFARIKIVAEPLPPGSGFVFEDKVAGGGVPKGIPARCREGPGEGPGLGRACRLPGGRPQGLAGAYRLTRGRFVGARVRDRNALRVVRGPAEGRLRAA
jgi:elongation factor G